MEFLSAFRAIVSEALVTAEASPDVRDEEPYLVRLVALAREHPEYRDLVEDELVALAARLSETPEPLGSVELLAYAVHTLQLARLVTSVEEMLADAEAAGTGGRPWEWARRYERVLQAQSPSWAERDMFSSLAP
jgi:hypothetical protein